MSDDLLQQFRPSEVINWDDNTKKLILLGYINNQQSILILQKKPFEKQVQQLLFDNALQYFHNDIYTKYTFQQLNEIDCELISPANQVHIDKYSKSDQIIIEETYEMFLKQQIIQMPLDWVYNILEKKKEVENIVFENKNFLILKDYVFVNSKNLEDLHLLALPFQRDIKSLRDLNQDHLQMLEDIYNEGLRIINEEYKLDQKYVKVFVHYLPSFYHFHVHFTHSSQIGQSFRDIPLSSIIQNIKLKSNYYQIVALQYVTRVRINKF
ncbi:unnamed protein product [Paramecium sonneborni]|uniref:M7GpppX diphosphatase n=1 Tax=Paramecium sonneborni TaxID=65129 RepID=A0A8S1RG73_9CILI|nr:unnamed protein product [Paramecium sonneborni]